MMIRMRKDERGSLALEQVLFIAAIVGMAAGLFAFYDNILEYFNAVNLGAAPAVPAPPAVGP